MTEYGMADAVGDMGNGRRTAADEVPLGRGLSTRLVVLTILFVMLAEVLIFLPSVANFRLQWLEQRLATAAAASAVLMESGPQAPSRSVQNELLRSLGAKAISMTGAQIGGGPDFAHLDHLRKDDVEMDGPGQALELGLPRFDAVIG